jgi:hypothetical protein
MLSCRGVATTSRRDAWLSLTPEPERELPAAVATLRSRGPAARETVEGERARVERLIVRARRSAWLTYLGEVVSLIEHVGASRDPEVIRARALALQVVRNHHRLLVGVPGRVAEDTADERSRLDAAAADGIRDSNGG